MKSKAELKTELEKLKADMALIMDKPASSQEVKGWVARVLEVKRKMENSVH
jgi:ribosomal protein L29